MSIFSMGYNNIEIIIFGGLFLYILIAASISGHNSPK